MQVLSDEWFEAVDEALADHPVDPSVRVVVAQVVSGTPDGGTLHYRLVVADGRARLVRGEQPPADVTLHTGWTTAQRIATGDIAASLAFLQGEIRIGGDTDALMTHAELIAEVGRITGSVGR
jgi:hypothetical protein